jgi:hypothetical protein
VYGFGLFEVPVQVYYKPVAPLCSGLAAVDEQSRFRYIAGMYQPLHSRSRTPMGNHLGDHECPEIVSESGIGWIGNGQLMESYTLSDQSLRL